MVHKLVNLKKKMLRAEWRLSDNKMNERLINDWRVKKRK